MTSFNEPSNTAAESKLDWNDPLNLSVLKPGTSPTVLKVHGFLIGLFFGVIGVVAVAILSSPEKRAHRVIGAGIGLAVWLPACVALSA
jgi:hypothetical protein